MTHSHKFFFGASVVVILIGSLFFGVQLGVNSALDLGIMNFAILFSAMILLLMMGGLVLEIKYELNAELLELRKIDRQTQKKRPKRKRKK